MSDLTPTREQVSIRGSVIDGQPYVAVKAPDGFMTLEDAQDLVNHIQAAIDTGKQFLSPNPPDES